MTDQPIRTQTDLVERTPHVLIFGAAVLNVEKLSTPLAFTRKPTNLSQLSGSEQVQVYVTETRILTVDEFDALARDFLAPCEWLRGKGGIARGGYLCVEVTAASRPYLYINPEGYDYARYVARLG